MPDKPLARRLITVPTVITLFIAVTVLSPLLVLVGVAIDLSRWLATRKPWVSVRVLAFLWVYLLGEVWAVAALAATAPLGRAGMGATFRLQGLWAAWNLRALQSLFSVELEVEGADSLIPGPVIILSRHASMVDTLLPARLVANGGLRLRYVLKKELLADPALDIAGNRLPNVFIDRASREGAGLASIRDLAAGMGPSEGILIYPEGTRFSETKLRKHQRRIGDDEGTVAAAVRAFRRVLPPRPGGALALLEASDADVVVLAHRGLEGLATVAEIWRGGLVGSTIEIALWRIPRADVPPTRPDQVEWLHRVWGDIDRWVVSREPDPGIP
ncbi:MAG: 1-acyl-sn-glycerol-3-phosphate acyltransferase [Actinomycetota bacterium]